MTPAAIDAHVLLNILQSGSVEPEKLYINYSGFPYHKVFSQMVKITYITKITQKIKYIYNTWIKF